MESTSTSTHICHENLHHLCGFGAVLTKERHQEAPDCRDWGYRDPLDHLDPDHPLLDTAVPGQYKIKAVR